MKETKDELKARLRAEYEKDLEIKSNLSRKYDDKNPRKISMIKSFNYAVEGIIYSLMSQRNMRVHYVFAVAILFASLFLSSPG